MEKYVLGSSVVDSDLKNQFFFKVSILLYYINPAFYVATDLTILMKLPLFTIRNTRVLKRVMSG